MIRKSRRRAPRPPRKLCPECGGHFYGWGTHCARAECVAVRSAPQAETLREFRRRVIDTPRICLCVGEDHDAANVGCPVNL